MKSKLTKKYEANIHLNSLYDVIVALRANGSNFFYPNDIKEELDILINKINNYIYHNHSRYDVIDEKWYSEFTFKTNKK